MKIRFAARNDIPARTEIGHRMVAVTRFAAYDFNAERLLAQKSAPKHEQRICSARSACCDYPFDQDASNPVPLNDDPKTIHY